jgi:hypothetical protein
MSGLRAGAAKAIITPPVGYPMGAWLLRRGLSTGVHDHLYAKALVLDDGARQIGMVALDLTGIAKETVGGIRTWVASYCNDYIGYISTRKPYEEIADVPLEEITSQDRYRSFYGTTTSPSHPKRERT